MGEATEHDMGHAARLLQQGGIQDRVVIAVDGAPPGGHAVDQGAAVSQLQADAMGGHHLGDRQGVGG
jgi:hypothetical protein